MAAVLILLINDYLKDQSRPFHWIISGVWSVTFLDGIRDVNQWRPLLPVVANITSADVTSDTDGRDCSFKEMSHKPNLT